MATFNRPAPRVKGESLPPKKETPPSNHFAGDAKHCGNRDLANNHHTLSIVVILQSSLDILHSVLYKYPTDKPSYQRWLVHPPVVS